MPNLTESEFEVRYHLFKETIYNIAYTYVKNKMDAEDITQDVFLKFLKYDGEFTTLDNEKYWLVRVTINTSKSFLTSSWKKKVALDDSATLIAQSESNDEVDYFRIITNLPNKLKEVIVLYYYENFKISEIAIILNSSESAIKKRLERARNQIKGDLEK